MLCANHLHRQKKRHLPQCITKAHPFVLQHPSLLQYLNQNQLEDHLFNQEKVQQRGAYYRVPMTMETYMDKCIPEKSSAERRGIVCPPLGVRVITIRRWLICKCHDRRRGNSSRTISSKPSIRRGPCNYRTYYTSNAPTRLHTSASQCILCRIWRIRCARESR